MMMMLNNNNNHQPGNSVGSVNEPYDTGSSHHQFPQQQQQMPGYQVYLLYQKEVHNTDHSHLQSMLDWLYNSIDSPYKFIIRNKCLIPPLESSNSLDSIQILNLMHPIHQMSTTSMTSSMTVEWPQIQFNLKHLKEIYVDKRHKDTCILVSRNPSATGLNSNYVWKKANPSNYQSFRTAYSMNSSYKKAYLLTILKFKEGPPRLLQFIQSLDSILAYRENSSPKLVNNEPNSNRSTPPPPSAHQPVHITGTSSLRLKQNPFMNMMNVNNNQQVSNRLSSSSPAHNCHFHNNSNNVNQNLYNSSHHHMHTHTSQQMLYKQNRPSIQEYFSQHAVVNNNGTSHAYNHNSLKFRHMTVAGFPTNSYQIDQNVNSSPNKQPAPNHHRNLSVDNGQHRCCVIMPPIIGTNNPQASTTSLYAGCFSNSSNKSLNIERNNCGGANMVLQRGLLPRVGSAMSSTSTSSTSQAVKYSSGGNQIYQKMMNMMAGSHSVPASPLPGNLNNGSSYFMSSNNSTCRNKQNVSVAVLAANLNTKLNNSSTNSNRQNIMTHVIRNNVSIVNKPQQQQQNGTVRPSVALKLQTSSSSTTMPNSDRIKSGDFESTSSSSSSSSDEMDEELKSFNCAPNGSSLRRSKSLSSSDLERGGDQTEVSRRRRQLPIRNVSNCSQNRVIMMSCGGDRENHSPGIMDNRKRSHSQNKKSPELGFSQPDSPSNNESELNRIIKENNTKKLIENFAKSTTMTTTTTTNHQAAAVQATHTNCSQQSGSFTIVSCYQPPLSSNSKLTNSSKKIHSSTPPPLTCTSEQMKLTTPPSPTIQHVSSHNKVRDIINNFEKNSKYQHMVSSIMTQSQPSPPSITSHIVVKQPEQRCSSSNSRIIKPIVMQNSCQNQPTSYLIQRNSNSITNLLSKSSSQNPHTLSGSKVGCNQQQQHMHPISNDISQRLNRIVNLLNSSSKSINKNGKNEQYDEDEETLNEDIYACDRKESQDLEDNIDDYDEQHQEVMNSSSQTKLEIMSLKNSNRIIIGDKMGAELKSHTNSNRQAARLVGPLPLNHQNGVTEQTETGNRRNSITTNKSGGRRTFANIIWPLDPEEERILRSESPIIVPEVIMQKNDRVKSILKKSGSSGGISTVGIEPESGKHCSTMMLDKIGTTTAESLLLSTNHPTLATAGGLIHSQSQTTSMCSTASSNKKRVDFLENFCFVNFFDINSDEMLNVTAASATTTTASITINNNENEITNSSNV